jgi:hypothetical protein
MPLTTTRDAGVRAGGDLGSLLELHPSAYYAAWAITGLVDGDPVGTWLDLSGNGNHATQATAAKKPLYKVNIVNGQPVVRFDAVDDAMTTSLVLTAPYTVFVVYDCSSAIVTGRRAVQGSSNWLIGPYQASWSYHAGAFVSGSLAAGADPPFVVDTFGINVAVNNTSRSWFYFNGTDWTNNSAPVGSPGTVSFGAAGFATAEPLSGDIALVAIFNRVLTASELRAVHRLLGNRYGIVVTL